LPPPGRRSPAAWPAASAWSEPWPRTAHPSRRQSRRRLLDATALATWISTLGFGLTLATADWSIIRGNHALARWTGWSALAIAAAFAACLPFTRTGTGHLPPSPPACGSSHGHRRDPTPDSSNRHRKN
jgi:hypothetical protein